MQLLLITLIISSIFALRKEDEAIQTILKGANNQVEKSLDSVAFSIAEKEDLTPDQTKQVRQMMKPIHNKFMMKYTPLVKKIVIEASQSQELIKRDEPTDAAAPSRFEKVKDFVVETSTSVKDFIKSIFTKLIDAWKTTIGYISETFNKVLEKIRSFIQVRGYF